MKPSVFLALLVFLASLSAQASIFTEQSDAGDFLDPQSVVGSDITQIQGFIGGDDLTDAFRFYFPGGPLAITAFASVLDVNNDTTLLALPFTLIDNNAYPPNPCAPTAPCMGADGLLDLSQDGLAAGNYIVGVCTTVDSCLPSDPPFTITFLTGPTTGQAALVSAPVPEPASLALLALGLASLALVTQRQRATRSRSRWAGRRC